MLELDYTIHLSDLVLIGGGIASFLKMFLTQRDINRDVLKLLKGETGTNGLVGDVKTLKHDVYETGGIVATVKHTIANLRVGLAAKGIEVPHDEH